ncbi:MAG: TonB-dependent receptor plug domain-containing protein [Bacteroidota bacterium]
MKKWFTDKIKIWKVMKICAMQAMIAMILVGVSAAHDTNGQLLDTKISLNLREVSLEDALKEIGRVAKVKFVYSEDQLGLKEAITFVAENRDLESILDELLTPYRIKFKVHEKEATITLKKQAAVKDNFRNPNATEASPKVSLVTGKVTDAATSQPLAGVNIIIKGTTTGTTSDAEGNFSIQANEDDNLVFSFIGYSSFETKVNGRSVIDVVLQEDAKNLNDVIINAGYYTTTKSFQTGNIVKIESKDIEKQPVSNPIAALQGRVPGLEVTQQTGVPGGNFRIRIRGTNSIANGNDPLYIIDGVPFTSASLSSSETSGNILGLGTNPLNGINPTDIESIEVLKDADATAIYGSRGSNGVILITTKRGKAGKTKVDLNFYSGGATVPRRMDLLNKQQYVAMRKEAFANDKIIPTAANARDPYRMGYYSQY